MGKICVLDVEVKGVQNIKETDLNARYLFVQPPDMEALVSTIFILINLSGKELSGLVQKQQILS